MAWGKVPQQETVKLNDVMSEELIKKVSEPKISYKEEKYIIEEVKETELEKAIRASLEEISSETEVKNKEEIDNDFAIALQLQEEENNSFYSTTQRQSYVTRDEKVCLVQQQVTELEEAYSNLNQVQHNYISTDYEAEDEEETRKLIENMMRFKISEQSREPNWPRRNRNLKGQGGNEEIITKHDLYLNSKKNLQRLADTNFDLKTGNLTNKNEKRPAIQGKVVNSLNIKTKRQIKQHQKLGNDNTKTASKQMDIKTLLNIRSMLNLGIILSISGVLKSGKEAFILKAEAQYLENINEEIKEFLITIKSIKKYKNEYAVKVFKTTLSEFKTRINYIKGDYRFKDILGLSKQNPRKIVKIWAEKEFKNLCKLSKANLPSPTPIKLSNNVILMTFLGKNNKPALQLHETNLSKTSYLKCYIECCLILKAMYVKCKLVHADFSEYNVLYFEKRCWVIDVGQSVLHNHPNCDEYLVRDCTNILHFFKKRNIDFNLEIEDLVNFIKNNKNSDLVNSSCNEEAVKISNAHVLKLSWVDELILPNFDTKPLFGSS